MQTNPSLPHRRTPRLLSLDSGGQRGLSQLTILAELMRRLNHDLGDDKKARPRDLFDMICGTGSGGFIAILLVVFGLDVETTKDEFIDLSAKILDLDVEARDRTVALRTHVNNLLSKYGIERNRPLLDPKIGPGDCKLVVPVSYTISVTSKCNLRNFDMREERPYDVTVAEALMATIANPPFFTPVSIFHDATTVEYIGGNLTFSNPALEVLTEARNAFRSGKGNVWLLSIGCGHPDVMAVPTASNALGWHSVLETLAKNAEGSAQHIEAEMGDQERYHRFSVLKGLGDPTQAITLRRGDIITHTMVYLGDTRVSREISRCVHYLKQPAPEVGDTLRRRQYHPRLTVLLPLCVLLWFLLSAYRGVCGNLLGIEHQLCHVGSSVSKLPEIAEEKSGGQIIGYIEAVLPDFDLASSSVQPYNSTDLLEQSDSADESMFSAALLAKPFVVRKDPWEYIKNVMLGTANSEKRGGRILVVTGIAGCGKTQIVLKFMQEYEAEFSEILRLDGSTESRIREDIIRYVRRSKKSQLSFKDSLHFLSRPSGNAPRLIVYDNVDDPNINLGPLLPHGSGCDIIVTSRNRSFGALSPSAHLPLDRMTIAEAVELLLYPQTQSSMSLDEIHDDARTAVEALGCLPIAIQQARRYMFETQMPSPVYLKRLRKSREDILAQPVEYQPDMRYLSTYAAFDASITILPDRSRQFLQLLSFFHWSRFPLELVLLAGKYDFSEYKSQYVDHGDEHQIGKATLEEIFLVETQWSPTNLDKLIVSLHKHSLITIVAGIDTSLLEMNSLLHGWLQSSLPDEYRLKYQSAAVLLLALGTRFRHTPPSQYLESHISHLSHLWRDLQVNNAAAFGEILANSGVFADALLLQEKVVAVLREPAKKGKIGLVSSLSALAITYRAAGFLKEAEILQLEALRQSNESLGPRHHDSIAMSHSLAVTYLVQERIKEAELLLVEVLRLRTDTLGERHVDTISASHNLAVVYAHQGRLKEAELIQADVLRLNKEVLGERHRSTISASNNLAVTRLGREQVGWPAVAQEGILRLMKETQGDRHPDTACTSNNLAMTYAFQRRDKEAEVIQEAVLRLRKEVLGEHHPDTISASHNLAVICTQQGRINEAEAILSEVLRLRKDLLGERHARTLSTHSSLAAIYHWQGRTTEAETLQSKILGRCNEILGVDHLVTLTTSSALAATYFRQERMKEAETLQLEILRLMKTTLGEHSLHTIVASINLATSYLRQGRPGEAEALQLEGLRRCKGVLGEPHFFTMIISHNLAVAYFHQNRMKEAELLQLEAIRLNKAFLGESHFNTVMAAHNLAATYLRQGRRAEAKTLQMEVLRILEEMSRHDPENDVRKTFDTKDPLFFGCHPALGDEVCFSLVDDPISTRF